jgi:hypothetical protein
MAMIRQQQLTKILLTVYREVYPEIPSMSWDDLEKNNLAQEVLIVYKELGGVLPKPSVKIDTWGLSLDACLVELDDHNHFNRYRRTTLQAESYDKLAFFPVDSYKNYCRKFEAECLKSGMTPNNWHSPKADRLFGAAGAIGDLSRNGATLWKLRAFEDYLKDLHAMIFPEFALMRVAVWEELLLGGKLTRLQDLLLSPTESEATAILNSFQRKLAKLNK